MKQNTLEMSIQVNDEPVILYQFKLRPNQLSRISREKCINISNLVQDRCVIKTRSSMLYGKISYQVIVPYRRLLSVFAGRSNLIPTIPVTSLQFEDKAIYYERANQSKG